MMSSSDSAAVPELVPVPATQAKVRFGQVLHESSVEGTRFVVTRQGRPVAVVLGYRDYCTLIEQS